MLYRKKHVWAKKKLPDLINPFRAAVFFENRQFLLKILKISKCSSSLNFWARRKLTPFLESLEPPLSDAYADREDFFWENLQKIFNVKKVDDLLKIA